MISIKEALNVPLYKRIVDEYSRKIMNGDLRPEDRIPNQVQLARLFNTSETTSKRALAELVNMGLIYRQRKRGTFVKGTAINKEPQKNPARLERIYFVHPSMRMRFINQGFYRRILDGIRYECDRMGLDFRLWDMGPGYTLPDGEANGYVLVTDVPGARPDFMNALEKWKAEGHRMVTVQFRYPHLHIPYVIGDNLTGGYLATQHLISLGHKRIGIILTGKSEIDINQEFSLRLQGYKLALSNYNIEFDPELVRVKKGDSEDESMGYAGFNELISLPEPPTAMFVTSDFKAVGAINAAHDQGFRVPEDISIIGYDGEEFGKFTIPGLTTIEQDTFEFGRRAARMLSRWEDDIGEESLMEIVTPKLVVRESTSVPKN